jgi:hypothetical protein
MKNFKKPSTYKKVDFEFRDGTIREASEKYDSKTFTYQQISNSNYLMSGFNRPGNESLLHYNFLLTMKYCLQCGFLYKDDLRSIVPDEQLIKLEDIGEIAFEGDRILSLTGESIITNTVTFKLRKKFENLYIYPNGVKSDKIQVIESGKYYDLYYKDKNPKEYIGTPISNNGLINKATLRVG